MRQESCKGEGAQSLANRGKGSNLIWGWGLVAWRYPKWDTAPFAVFANSVSQKGWGSSDGFLKEVHVWILLTRVSRSLFHASSAKTGFSESRRSERLSGAEAEGLTGVWREGLPQALRGATPCPSQHPHPPHSQGGPWREIGQKRGNQEAVELGPFLGPRGTRAQRSWLPACWRGRGGAALVGGVSELQTFFPSSPLCFPPFVLTHSRGCTLKEGWALKISCIWTVGLEKTLKSPLHCKEIQPVHPKGDQSWVFLGRTDAEVDAPSPWPPDAKNWLIWEDPDAGEDWRREEKGVTEDELVGWHHWLNGHEFEPAPGDSERQGNPVCCSPWGCKGSGTT